MTDDTIAETTREVLATVHAFTDKIPGPPENGRAVLLGIAAVMIERNLGDSVEPSADAINAVWRTNGFPWRMVRLQ